MHEGLAPSLACGQDARGPESMDPHRSDTSDVFKARPKCLLKRASHAHPVQAWYGRQVFIQHDQGLLIGMSKSTQTSLDAEAHGLVPGLFLLFTLYPDQGRQVRMTGL